jgi:ubiquinone/menaquinone biosynthesis C-methylase UbiE
MGHTFDPRHIARLEDPERLIREPPEVVLDLLSLTGDETVVDYGAGTGAFTLPLAHALPRGRVVAVDLSEVLLARLADKLDDELRRRVQIVLTSDNHVPLPDASVQAVLTVDVWHEIHDEPAASAEMMRLLAPEGRLVVVDWARVERPVGPPVDHVLSVADARAGLEALGLAVTAVHDPGELFAYHFAIVAQRPADAR